MTISPAPTGDPASPTAPVPAPGPRRRGFWVSLGAGLAALAVIGGGIALGGLEERSDHQLEVPVGTPIKAGNLTYTFTGATVQRVDRFSGPIWELVANGTVSNPHDTPLAPLGGNYGSFLAFEPGGDLEVVAESGSWLIGGAGMRDLVPPGDRPLSLQLEFELPPDHTPTDTVGLAVSPMEFTDNAVLGLAGGEKAWNVDSFATIHYLTLPVERLPDEVSG